MTRSLLDDLRRTESAICRGVRREEKLGCVGCGERDFRYDVERGVYVCDVCGRGQRLAEMVEVGR